MKNMKKHLTFNIQRPTLNHGARRLVPSMLNVECWALNFAEPVLIVLSFALALSPVVSAGNAIEADLAACYAPSYATSVGGEDNAQVLIANAVIGNNLINDQSGSGAHMRIAGFYQSSNDPINWTTTGGMVNWLSANNANVSDVVSYGTAVGADLVTYICQNSDSGSIAAVAQQPGMYSALNPGAVWYVVVAHETGGHCYGRSHNDGLVSPKTVMLHNYCSGGAAPPYFYTNPNIWFNGVQLLGNTANNCSMGALVNGGDNSSLSAQSVADRRTHAVVVPNLNRVVRHWSFTNAPGAAPASTTNYDLVSGAPAIVRGNGATYTGSALRIPGGTTGNVAIDSMAAYLDLPNGIISSQTNLTIEIWATPLSAPSYARILDFGRTVQSGDGLGASGEYTGTPGTATPGTTQSSDDILLSAAIGTDIAQQRFEAKLNGFATTLDSSLATATNGQHHYAVTFTDGAGAAGSAGGRWQWYRDGDAIAYLDVTNHLADIEDVNNWLGRSMWSDDAMANNDYAEVRISNVALSRGEVLANCLLGPNYVPTATVNLTNSDGFGTTSFNAAGQWSSGAAPAGGNSYETYGFQLRTPATSSAYTFGGDSLQISGGQLLWKGTASSTITITNLTLNGGMVANAGSGTCALAGNLRAMTNGGTFNGVNGGFTVTASLDGGGPLICLANATTLSGANSAFTGKMMIGNGMAGTLVIDSPARLGASPTNFIAGQLTLNRGTLQTTTTMSLDDTNRGILLDVSGGTFNVASGTTLTLASALSSPVTASSIVVGSLTKTGAGTLVLSSPSNSFKGTLFVDTASASGNDGAVKVVNSQVLTNAHSPIFIRNNNSGTSTLQLEGMTGNITLPQTIALSGRTSASVSVENLAGTNTIAGGITLNSGADFYVIQSDAGLLNLGGTISSLAAGARTFTFQGAGNLNITGVVTNGSATVNVTKSGSGTLTLSGANTFTGTNRVTGGSELLANSSALQSCFVEMNAADSGTLSFGSLTTALFGALTGTRDLWLTNAGGTAVTLTAGNNHQDATYSGALSGPGGLTKTGSGAFTLSGANLYTGATTVSAGKLLVNGSTSTSAVTATGGSLGGIGVVNGPVTIQSGGSLAPGADAVGRLTISNTLSLSGATMIELNKTGLTNDSISGLTSVTFGGSLVVTNLAGTLAGGDSFKIFAANSCVGAFAALVPATPGPGLGWNTNTLASDGTLRVNSSGVAAPTALAAAPAYGMINLSWTQSAAPSVTQNNIYRSIAGSSGPFTLLTNVPAAVAYADAGVVNGSTYYYAVTAITTNGESVFSGIAGTTAGGTPPSVLPYTVDAATLHLWHFDGAGTVTTDEVQTAGITLTNRPQPASPGSTISLGNAGFNSYFHSCLRVIATNFNLGNCYAFASNSVGSSTGTTSFCNATNGAFTFEAMVKMDGAPTNGNGNWEIICGDNPSNVAGVRGWQFRIISGSTGTVTPRLEFNSINTSSGTMGDFFANLPATGANAWATGQWYHVALTYTGTNGTTPGVLGFYWTRVDTNTAVANLITNFSGLTGVLGGNPILAVGGSARNNNGNANGEGFKGAIDEVRISNVARYPTNMIFHTVVVNGTWAVDADGNWSDAGKWSSGLFAVGPGGVADFSTLDITASRTVTLDSSRTIGTLLYGDISGSQNWTLASGSGSVLTLNSGSSTPPSIVVSQNIATVTAVLAGTNGLAKTGAGTLVLAATNTYVNTTIVNGGTLAVNGSVADSLAVVSGTLAGAGAITGEVIVLSGATLAPGFSSIGTLTFGNALTLMAGSTTVMELDQSALTNDQLKVTGMLTCGGNLLVTNLAGTLAAGDSFRLFNAGSCSGAFAGLSPVTPGTGLVWNTNTLTTDGTLRIAAAAPPVINSVVIAGNSFQLSVTGGPPSSPYRVFSSTNLVLPLTNWTPIWTDTFNVYGLGQFTNPAGLTNVQQYFNVTVP
jgi:fibronectin-binding autotransporter adhesin